MKINVVANIKLIRINYENYVTVSLVFFKIFYGHVTNKCKSKAFQISMCSGDNNLTFEGGMGDFRTERLISGENNSCHKIPGKKIPALKKISFMAYYAGKKFLHRCTSGKNSITRGL